MFLPIYQSQPNFRDMISGTFFNQILLIPNDLKYAMHNDDSEHVLYVNNCLICVYFHFSQETAKEPSWTKSPGNFISYHKGLKKKLYKHNKYNLGDQFHCCYLCLAHPLSYCPKRMEGVGKKLIFHTERISTAVWAEDSFC